MSKRAKSRDSKPRSAGPRRPPASKTKKPIKVRPPADTEPPEDQVVQTSERAFSWYPGHMVKAKRELEQHLKLTDAVLLMLDARAPQLTRHPELEQMLTQRSSPFVLVLNKSDLAEEEHTERWRAHLKAQGHKVVELSALRGHGAGPLTPMLDQVAREVNAKRANKGLLPRVPRLMVAGLPNSGKSTLLNRLVGQGRFKAGKKPGLTRGTQWVSVAGHYQLLDTPGILYPRIEGELALALLAALGSVRRDILPQTDVARRLLQELSRRGRLAALLPGMRELKESDWRDDPLTCLAQAWGFSDPETQTQRAFDRLLNLFSERTFRISWQTVEAPGSSPS